MNKNNSLLYLSVIIILSFSSLKATARVINTQDNFPLKIAQNSDLSQEAQEQLVNAVYLKQDGYNLFRQGNIQEALAKYQEALAIFRKFKTPAGEGDILNYMGEIYLALNDNNKALELFKQALDIFQDLSKDSEFDPSYEAYTWQYLGETYTRQKDLNKAVEAYQNALDIFNNLIQTKTGNQESLQTSIIYTLNPLASLYFQLGNYPKSLELYNQVLSIQNQNDDFIGFVQTMNNLGVVAANLNQYAEALSYYEKALNKLHTFSNCDPNVVGKICFGGDEAAILNNLATLYFTIGQYEQAIKFSEQATALYQRLKGTDFNDLKPQEFQLLYDTIGAASINALVVNQSLAIRPAVGNNFFKTEAIVQQGEAVNYNNLGQIYSSQGKYDQSLVFYQKALKIYQESDNKQGMGITLNNIARVFLNLKDFQKALDFNQKALTIYQEVGDQTGIGITLSNLGQIYHAQGNFKKGEEVLNQALTIHQKNSDRSSIATTLTELALIQLKEQKISNAIDNLQQAVTLIESLKPGLNDASKVAFFETHSLTYSWLQKALIDQGKIEEALVISEQSKARAFVELLAQRLTESELNSNNNTTISIAAPTLETIKLIAAESKATLVQYSLIPDNRLLIWVIKPNGEISFRQVDLSQLPGDNSQIKLTGLVINSRQALLANSTTNNYREKLRQLHQILIQPIEDLLPNNPEEAVFFIPQGALFMIPFAALLDEDSKYLIEKHTIVMQPSIQTIELTQQQRLKNQQIHPQNITVVGIPRSAVIVGNPTMPTLTLNLGQPPQILESLPGAEKEAEAVAKVLKNQPLIGNQATKTTVIQQMLNSKIIHLATHGLLDDLGRKGIPGAIALAPSVNDDGLLTASEIINLKLNADLVVLSACNTGRGKITGDGVIGLSRSFLGAGASSVIVSLWEVQDESTSFLMPEFYHQLEQNPSKAQALRQGMLKTMQSYPHPAAWAAFTLMGSDN